MIGTWMQSVAQSWLVLELTGSGTALGLVIALQTLPVLFGAPYAGLIADRVDKRRLLVITQSVMGVLALVLGLLTVTDTVQLWMVYVLAVGLGAANAVDNPTRQSFILEMVGPEHLRNAVTLNSVLVNAARAVGPAVAGILIATIGVGICFLVNAGTFAAVLFALITLDRKALRPSVPAPRERGQLRAGFAYVRHTSSLLVPLGMMALVGCLAYEFQVVLPIVARSTYDGGPQAYGFLTAAMGIGAVVGGLAVASRGLSGTRPLIVASTVFGVVILIAAAAPNLAFACVAMALVGAGSVAFLAIGNSTLQLAASPQMRGRVMALWAVAFLGSTPDRWSDRRLRQRALRWPRRAGHGRGRLPCRGGWRVAGQQADAVEFRCRARRFRLPSPEPNHGTDRRLTAGCEACVRHGWWVSQVLLAPLTPDRCFAGWRRPGSRST